MTAALKPAKPMVEGNQGSLALSTWPDFFNVAAPGHYNVSIPYSAFLPEDHEGEPDLFITSAQILVQGVQAFNQGAAWLTIQETYEGETNWKFICHVNDGQVHNREHYNPGVILTPDMQACFTSFWGGYSAGPDGYGNNAGGGHSNTNRQFNVQLIYKIGES